jgi:hypothetical protein
MSITSQLNTTQRMLGQNYVTLQSAVSSYESLKAKVATLDLKRFTAAEKSQLSNKIKKQRAQLEKAFHDQLSRINSELATAEKEHAIKTKPSSSDFNYLPLLAGKNASKLTEMGRASTTAARLLAEEGAMFGLSPELTRAMSKAASPETYEAIEQLDEAEIRIQQLQESAMKEANAFAQSYQVDTDTQAQADFLNDAGEGGEL